MDLLLNALLLERHVPDLGLGAGHAGLVEPVYILQHRVLRLAGLNDAFHHVVRDIFQQVADAAFREVQLLLILCAAGFVDDLLGLGIGIPFVLVDADDRLDRRKRAGPVLREQRLLGLGELLAAVFDLRFQPLLFLGGDFNGRLLRKLGFQTAQAPLLGAIVGGQAFGGHGQVLGAEVGPQGLEPVAGLELHRIDVGGAVQGAAQAGAHLLLRVLQSLGGRRHVEEPQEGQHLVVMSPHHRVVIEIADLFLLDQSLAGEPIGVPVQVVPGPVLFVDPVLRAVPLVAALQELVVELPGHGHAGHGFALSAHLVRHGSQQPFPQVLLVVDKALEGLQAGHVVVDDRVEDGGEALTVGPLHHGGEVIELVAEQEFPLLHRVGLGQRAVAVVGVVLVIPGVQGAGGEFHGEELAACPQELVYMIVDQVHHIVAGVFDQRL